jgi:MFS family permease
LNSKQTSNDHSAASFEPARVSWTFIGIFALAYTGIWLALLTPVIVTIALRVRQLTPEHAAQNLALILSVGAACAMFAGPLFGHLSDRTSSRFGMRRPWMIGGMLGGCIALAFVATSDSILGIVLGWCAAQIAFNAALATTVALLADQIPAAQRGTVAGILGVCMPIGQLIGTFIVQLLASSILLSFMVPAAVGAAAVLLLASVLPDRRLRHVISRTPLRDALNAFRIERHRYRDFWCAWLSRFLLGVGSAFLTTYQPLYLVENLSRDPGEVPLLVFRSMLLQSILIVIVSLVSGRLSDRWRRRRIFVMVGALIYALGLWLIAGAPSYGVFLIGLAVAAIAHGMYFAVDLALVTEVLPDSERDAAKDLGILNIANALPQVIAPLTGAAILMLADHDYTTMYSIAGAIAVGSALAILPMRFAR